MNHSFTRVVAYGCSFTKGDELCDHELEPNADAIKKELGCQKFTTDFLYKNHLPEVVEEMIKRQKELSWAGQIAKKLNVPIENRAEGGLSAGAIFSYFLIDLNAGRITDTDLVLIGYTSPFRVFHINKHNQFNTLLTSFPEMWIPELQTQKEFLINNLFTDENMLFSWHSTLINLIYYAEHKLPGRMFIAKCNWHHTHTSATKQLRRLFTEFEKETNSSPAMSTKILYDFLDSTDIVHGGGHPSVGVHIKFADYVFEELKKYLSTNL